MTWTLLVWRNLWRHPLRTALTTFSIALSIFLVCAVLTLPDTLNRILDRATSDVRVSVHHKAGLTYWLPAAFIAKVRSVPHVQVVNHYSWFGGIYDEPKNMFPNFAIDPDTAAEMWPDYHIDPEALAKFRKIRNAAIVGWQTMRKFGWKVGQEITLKGTVFPVDLTFQIVGEIPASAPGNPVVMWFNYKYLDESLLPRPGYPRTGAPGVGMIWVRADSPANVDGVMRAVDDLFRNSEAETAAETEKSFFKGFTDTFAGLVRIILAVGFLVVLAVVLIAANTSAMGVRERLGEIAVMKSLGFQRRAILGVLLTESTLQGFAGGVVGAGTAYGILTWLRNAGVTGGDRLLGPLSSFAMTPTIAVEGVAVAIVVGFVAGAVPAWNGAQLNVVEAFRRLF
ncbi:MAG: ABC transporter permease [Candidatus Binatia bacterium]